MPVFFVFWSRRFFETGGFVILRIEKRKTRRERSRRVLSSLARKKA